MMLSVLTKTKETKWHKEVGGEGYRLDYGSTIVYVNSVWFFYKSIIPKKKIIINNWEKRKGQGKLQMLGKDYFPK